jgi:hypothetical protein
MRNVISSHYAKIGRRGGLASTPAKREAARRNALKRWRGHSERADLPLEALRDGTWYRGQGRNSQVGLWDAQAKCFWTIAINDFADPANYPANPERQVRLKQEGFLNSKQGTFKPTAALET